MLRYHYGSGPASDPFDAGEAACVRVPLPRGEVYPSVARDSQAEINRPAKAENRLLLSTSHATTRSCERSARISSAALCHELRHGRKPFSPRRSQFAERRVGRQRHGFIRHSLDSQGRGAILAIWVSVATRFARDGCPRAVKAVGTLPCGAWCTLSIHGALVDRRERQVSRVG